MKQGLFTQDGSGTFLKCTEGKTHQEQSLASKACSDLSTHPGPVASESGLVRSGVGHKYRGQATSFEGWFASLQVYFWPPQLSCGRFGTSPPSSG